MRLIIAFMLVGLASAVALLAWPQDAVSHDGVDLFPHQIEVPIESGDWTRTLADRVVRSSRAGQPVSRTEDSPLDSVTLIGTVEDDRGGWALLMQAGDLITLAIGAELDGYVLVELTPEGAVFERNGSRISVARET